MMASSIREEVLCFYFIIILLLLLIYLFQITGLSKALELAQSRLVQLAKRVEQQDQDTENWKGRYADLEVAYREALTSAKWLRVHNAELERNMASYKPERESALQKLKHARKVIRDLIDERVSFHGPW